MKKKTKKITALICSLFFVLQPLVYVSAATVPAMEGIKAYTISNGNVYTYTAIDGAYSGYISGSVDLCNIVKVYDSGWCKVSYPTSRGTKTAYTKSSNFFTNLNFSNTYVQLGKNLTVYRKKTGNQRIGSVYSTDSVLIIGQSNNRTQIVYPAGNSYKMGWISGVYSVNGEQAVDVKDGYYQIKSAINSDYVIDVYGGWNDDGTNVQLYKNQRSLNQGFYIKKQSDGYYTITALHSGKALDVERGGAYDGANVLQWTLNGGDNQKWKIVKTSDGFYSFISKCSGLYLDANGAKADNEVNIQCWTGNGTKAQKFVLEQVKYNEKENEESSTQSSGTTYYVKTQAGLYLRSSASYGSVLAVIPYGSMVTVYSESNGWAYLNYNGIKGYASITYLTKQKPSNVTTGYAQPISLSRAQWSSSTDNAGCQHDIQAANIMGQPVYAIDNGTIRCVQIVSDTYGGRLVSYGNVIYFTSMDGKTTATYAHLNDFSKCNVTVSSSYTVQKSQRACRSVRTIDLGSYDVNKGELIGYVGTTGNSTGAHLHFELFINGVRKNPPQYVKIN